MITKEQFNKTKIGDKFQFLRETVKLKESNVWTVVNCFDSGNMKYVEVQDGAKEWHYICEDVFAHWCVYENIQITDLI